MRFCEPQGRWAQGRSAAGGSIGDRGAAALGAGGLPSSGDGWKRCEGWGRCGPRAARAPRRGRAVRTEERAEVSRSGGWWLRCPTGAGQGMRSPGSPRSGSPPPGRATAPRGRLRARTWQGKYEAGGWERSAAPWARRRQGRAGARPPPPCERALRGTKGSAEDGTQALSSPPPLPTSPPPKKQSGRAAPCELYGSTSTAPARPLGQVSAPLRAAAPSAGSKKGGFPSAPTFPKQHISVLQPPPQPPQSINRVAQITGICNRCHMRGAPGAGTERDGGGMERARSGHGWGRGGEKCPRSRAAGGGDTRLGERSRSVPKGAEVAGESSGDPWGRLFPGAHGCVCVCV